LAADRFRKLEKSIRERIAAKLEVVADNPYRYLSRLSSLDAFKLRIGDYRLIIDMDAERRKLYVVTLGHRSTVYR
jgi:mRNA interferase RelE/StbE